MYFLFIRFQDENWSRFANLHFCTKLNCYKVYKEEYNFNNSTISNSNENLLAHFFWAKKCQ